MKTDTTLNRAVRIASLALAVGLWSAGSQAFGQIVSFDFPTTAIPDNDLNGLTSTAVVPSVASIDDVALTISHEWLGDLTVKLISPTGAEFVLVERQGVSVSDPDGSSMILGTPVQNPDTSYTLSPQTYHFAPAGVSLNSVVLNPSNSGSTVPNTQTYAAQSWSTGPFPAGTWTVTAVDAAAMSTGDITLASFNFTPVPEPATAGLYISALLLTAALLRKRSSGRTVLNP